MMLLAAHAQAGSISAPLVVAPLVRALSGEPFGLKTALLADGGLRDKWMGLRRALEQDLRTLELCRQDRTCESGEARMFLAIIDDAAARDGLARLGQVNRAINLAIRPGSDLANYGEEDHWSSPLATLAKGSGDCEDYAIAKLVALENAGVPAADLRLLIVRDAARAQDHALLAVRLDDQWIMLDNKSMVMLRDTEMAGYQPTFVIGENGVSVFRRDTTTPASPAPAADVIAARELAMLSFGFVPN